MNRGAPIPVGISSCLLGQAVRYDGGHKRDAYILGTLSRYFELRPFCPEVAAGLGIPRPTIRLVAGRADATPRVVEVQRAEREHTSALLTASREEVARRLGSLDGYILKKGSPSCGMERVKVYGPNGYALAKSSGVFAAELMRAMPHLPVEEEGRLGDPVLRENFIERVFVHHRWRVHTAPGITPARLVEFHSDHKYAIMAHNQEAYRRLGRWVARAGIEPIVPLAEAYFAELMQALRRPATPKGQANLLLHLMGYLKRDLDSADRQELVEVIDAYRLGQLPLIVPITLLRHHFRRHPHPYIERQSYLDPYPAELKLRNLI